MNQLSSKAETRIAVRPIPPLKFIRTESLAVEALGNEHREELLWFLSRRPIHTVCMSAYVRDNGVVSSDNRGLFYGCRTKSGHLEGIALIGHATLIETQNDEALRAFAYLKHVHNFSHLVRGEHEMIARFWSYYAELGHRPRLARRELLFEYQAQSQSLGPLPGLRLARLDELEQLASINAEIIRSECHIDPMKKDPIGFRQRLAKRIERERIWMWEKNERMIFKADVFAETPQMAYLEGVFIHPDERRKGYGLRCLSHLSRLLLKRSRSICLFINERKEGLSDFYQRAGYEYRGVYDTIYLHPEAN
jgi:predicted GNAT family acetyltransferase